MTDAERHAANLKWQLADFISKADADRRARLRRTVSDALCLATLALIAVMLANAMLTTALALPDLAAQAIALKGM